MNTADQPDRAQHRPLVDLAALAGLRRRITVHGRTFVFADHAGGLPGWDDVCRLHPSRIAEGLPVAVLLPDGTSTVDVPAGSPFRLGDAAELAQFLYVTVHARPAR